jgi:hypothetical protein
MKRHDRQLPGGVLEPLHAKTAETPNSSKGLEFR